MNGSPATRASLIARIRDPSDGPAWNRFVDTYAPLIHGYARKQGLQDADAMDLTQDVLQAVASAMRRKAYDSSRGSFRGWLFAISRNELRDFLRERQRRVTGTGDTSTHAVLQEAPAPEEEAWWDREHERTVFQHAAELVRQEVQPATWQAFWLTAIEARPANEVAAGLGTTVAAVYLAKSRVMARLKERVRELEE